VNKASRNSGSIVLEAAIGMSLFLVLICAAISSITSVNADLYMQRASENVVAELNVAIPFVTNGVQSIDDVASTFGLSDKASIDTDKMDEVLGMFGSLSGATGVDLEDVAGTAVFGRYVRDRIVTEYRKLVNKNWIYDEIVQNISVYIDYEEEDRSIYINVYYDISAGKVKIERSYCTSVALYTEMFALRSDGKDSANETASVWDKDNFERGTAIREKFGGNLPYNFPVISSYKENEVTSIKSMDTTSPYYQEQRNVKRRLVSYINDLQKFSGAEQSGVSVSVTEKTKKVLLLVIPENGTAEGDLYISELSPYASERGIELKVVKFEEKSDEIYISCVHALYEKEKDLRRLYVHEKLYELMEEVSDRCREVCRFVQNIALKNI